VRFDPSDREAIVELHHIQHPANLLDQVLVATPFDRTVRKEPHTVLAVSDNIVVSSGVASGRRETNPLKSMVKGTTFLPYC